MSNKTQLQTNNTALDGYIARINAAKDVAAGLPEAGGSGGGGNVETCTVTVISGNGITEQQNMQIIASAYENNVITTVNKTVDVFYYPEEGMGSRSVILNVINNTPVTLVFSKTAPSLPPGTITGEATFICNNENTISFTVMPDSSGLCNIILI